VAAARTDNPSNHAPDTFNAERRSASAACISQLPICGGYPRALKAVNIARQRIGAQRECAFSWATMPSLAPCQRVHQRFRSRLRRGSASACRLTEDEIKISKHGGRSILSVANL